MTIIIGLSGKAGSGKDTFAQRLVDKHGFTRLAFADPLKEILRRTNPIIRVYGDGGGCDLLSGVEGDPKRYSEYRWLMQNLGTALREVIDRDIWTDLLTYEMLDRESYGLSRFVITDVRMWNEAEWVARAAGCLLRIVRPDAPGLGAALDAHQSEWDLDDMNINEVLNDGTIEDLWTKADLIAEALIEKEEC